MKNNKRVNEMYAGKEVTVDCYRKMIIELVGKFENVHYIKRIYKLVEYLYVTKIE